MEVMQPVMFGVSPDGQPRGLRNSVTIVISNQSSVLRWEALETLPFKIGPCGQLGKYCKR